MLKICDEQQENQNITNTQILNMTEYKIVYTCISSVYRTWPLKNHSIYSASLKDNNSKRKIFISHVNGSTFNRGGRCLRIKI